jgi:hypothetical protein
MLKGAEELEKISRRSKVVMTIPSQNQYYASVFSGERNSPQIQQTDSDNPFNVNINIIRKRLSATGRKKSVRPDGIPGVVLKLDGEAMIPYLARLLDITVNNRAIPGDWKNATVDP